MKRRIHNIMAAFLCVCLLVSYIPTQAIADSGTDELGEFVNGQASTDVKVIIGQNYDFLFTTESFAATRDQIANDKDKDGNPQYDLNVKITGGTAPYTYTWTKSVAGKPDVETVQTKSSDALSDKYELSKHAKDLAAGSECTFKIVVKDSNNSEIERSIKVIVSDKYDYKTLEKDNVAVTADIHYMAELSVSSIGSTMPIYSDLQEAVGGKKIINALQVGLTANPSPEEPLYVGEPTVDFVVEGMDGKTITVVCIDAKGKKSVFDNVAVAGGKASIVMTDTQGVFGAIALAYDAPGATHTITSSVKVDPERSIAGGQISPLGTRTYPEGATPSYILLPDSGYVIDQVFIDGAATGKSIEGNTYTFEPLQGDPTAHSIEASFKKASSAGENVKLTARVENGNGKVRIDDKNVEGENVSVEVEKATSATIKFIPNSGYVIDTVKVNNAPVTVMGDTYLLSAVLGEVSGETTVVVTYKEGVKPPVLYHTVTTTTDGAGGTISESRDDVEHGKFATVYFYPDENYRLSSVTVGEKDVTSQVSENKLTIENIVTDLTVKATFEYIEHTVNASAGEGGTISPAGEKKVKDGESLAYYFNPEKGYELSSLLLQSGTDAAVDVTADVKGGVYLLENIRGNYTLTAAFVPSSVPPEDVYYTITASAGGGGKISPEGVSRLKAGESQTFSLTPDDTHKVKQVIVNGTSVAFNGFSYTINNVRQNTTIHVEFEAADTPPELPKSYSVETSAGLGGSVSPKGKTTVYEHGSVLVKFLPDAGYQLRAVNVNGVEVPAGDIVDNSYRVYVDKYKDTSATAPVPVSVDAMFEPIKTPPTDPDYCMLTTKVGAGSGTVSPEGTTKVPYGKDQTIHFIPDSGNRIKSVTVGSDLVDLNEIKNNTYLLKGVTKDTTVTVEYENQPGPVVSQHTVTATATAGGTISPEGVTTVNDGGSLTYTFTAQEGYKLFSVLVGSQTVSVVGSSYTLTGISNDCTITAVFKENSLPVDKKYHTIHASAAAGGKISPAGDVRVASGKDMTFYFQPDNGKVVDTVTVDGKETTSPAGNSYTFPSVTGDSSINVTFREKGGTDPVPPTVYWTLTATSTTGGAISPSGETQVTPGGQMLYTIIADEGYELKTLYVDNKPVADFSGDTYRFSAVTKEHSIHAEFAKKSSTPDPTVRHTVTASVTDETSGSISPKGETSVPANGTQTFYFTPAGDNGVKSITITKGKDSDKTTQTFAYTGLSYTLTGINADTSIEVTFGSGGIKPPVPLMYEVTTTITDGGGTVSPGNSKVAKGGSLLLTFTPDAGYVLKLVKQGDKDITTQVKADGSYRLTNVTENTTITATFEKGINGNNYRMVSVSAGEGGTISPAGEMRIAKGGVQSFTVVPAEKKELDKITIQYADKAAQEISTDELQKVVDTGYFVFENATELDFSCKIVASFKDRADAPAPDPAKYVTLNTTATTGGAISPSGSMTVAKGSSVLYTLTPDAGYKLSSVIVGDKPVDAALIANNTYMHEATSDAAIKATFVRTSENPEPGYYQVTTSVGEATDGKSSGTISPSGITRVKAGESQTFTFIPNTGCTLDTVTVGGEKVAVDGFTYTLFDVTEDTAIVATFKVAGGTDPEPPAMATIKASASAGGSISPVGTTKAAVGTSPLFTLTPDAGYHIASVVVDGTAIDADKLVNNTYRFDPVEANKDYTIVANYEANPVKPVDPASYRVFASVVNGEGGQISPAGEQKVAAGASQSFSFLPDTGYVVDKVWVKNSPIEPTLDLSFVPEGSIYTLFGVNSEMYIAVSFKKSSDPNPPVDTCTIKSSSTAGGSISPEGETTVAAGSSLTYTFTAFEGYELYQVKIDETTTKPASEITNNSYRYTNTTGGGTHSVKAMYKIKGSEPAYPDDPDKPSEKVKISASAGEGGSISPAGDVLVEKGSSATYYIDPETGYELNTLTLQLGVDGEPQDVTADVKGDVYVIKDVQSDAILTATFKQGVIPEKKYTVTASASTGGTITPSGSFSVSENASVQFALKADANCELKKLIVGGVEVPDINPALTEYSLDKITEDTTVRAEFQPISVDPKPTYAVVHATAGPNGSISPTGDVQVPLYSDRTFVFTPNDGYTVGQVFLDGNPVDQSAVVGNTYTIKGITEDTTLKVTFVSGKDPNPPAKTHTITSSTTSGGTISPYGSTQVVEGENATYLIKADKGYHLSKLEVDSAIVETKDNTYTFTNVTGPHTIKASFEKTETPVDPEFVTVHAKAGAGGTISPEGDSRVKFGYAQTFTIIPNSGMVVDKLTVDGVATSFSGSSYTIFNVRADKAIEVSFKSGTTPPQPTLYTLSAKAAAGGTISPAGDTKVVAGESLLYSIMPDKGYKISSVKVDGIEVVGTLTGPSYRFADVSGNHSIAVAFEPESKPPVQQYWTIDASVAGDAGGTISPAGTTRIADGGTQTFYFTPDTGKQVKQVIINKGQPSAQTIAFTGSAYTLYNVTMNTSIEVTFGDGGNTPKPTQHTVTTKKESGEGQVFPDPGKPTQVNDGGALLVTFIPDTGWEVGEVSVDGTLVQKGGKSYRLTNVVADKEVSVTFVETKTPDPGPTFQPVTVKVMPTAEGKVGGTVSPAGSLSVPTGQSKKFYIYPASGHTVDKVLANGAEILVSAVQASNELKPGTLAHRADLPSSSVYSFDLNDVRAETNVEVHFVATGEEPPTPVPTHAVTASASTGGMIFSSGLTMVPHGKTIDFAIKADNGYHLAELLKTTNGTTSSIAPSEVVNGVYSTTVEEDMLLHAVFEADPVVPTDPEYVTVSASVVGDGSISPQGDTRVKFGESQTFTFIPQGTSGLKEVTVNGKPVITTNSTYTIYDLKEDTQIVATFSTEVPPVTPTTYTLSATAGAGGSVSPSGSTTVGEGGSLLYTIHADEGYVLDSVKDTTGGATNDITGQVVNNTFRVSNVSADHSFAVTFKAEKVDPPAPTYCTVSATSGANGKISPSGDMKVNIGSSATYSFLPNSGYVVDTVTVDGRAIANANNPYTLYDLKADTRINVTFKQGSVPPLATHTIDASVEGGESGHGTVSPAGKTSVIEGSSMVVNFIPDSGYVVDRVMVDGAYVSSPSTSYQFSSIDKDHALVVSFRGADEPPTKMYTLTPSAGTGGSINPSSPVTVEEGQSQTFTFTPNEGYAVSAVKIDGVNKGAASSYTFTDVQASHTIAVEFAQAQKFTISASAGEGGTIAPSGDVTVSQGAWKTFVFTPNEGYAVSAMTIDGVRTETSVRSYTFSDVQSDHTINVEFASGETVKVTASAGEGGAISPSGTIEVVKGDQCAFMLHANEGYRVDKVMLDGKVVQVGGTSYTLMDAQDGMAVSVTFAKTIAPNPDEPFVDVDVEVKVSAGSEEGGLVSPSGTVTMVANSSQKFYAFPEKGYTLDKVLVDGVTTQFYGLTSTKTAALYAAEELSDEAKALLSSTNGAFGGFWFEISNPTNGMKVEVQFRPLGEDEPQPEPVLAHTVTASASPGGMISPLGDTMVPDGESMNFSFKADAGYHLKSLEVGGVDVTEDIASDLLSLSSLSGKRMKGMYTLSNVTADTLVVATYEASPAPVTYAITASVEGGHGKVSPSGLVTCIQGSNQAFYFIPDAGYQVASVTVDGQAVEASSSYTFYDIQAAHNLAVSFKVQVTPGPVNPLDPLVKQLTRTGDTPLVVWIGLIAIFAGAVVVAVMIARRPRSRHEYSGSQARSRRSVKQANRSDRTIHKR